MSIDSILKVSFVGLLQYLIGESPGIRLPLRASCIVIGIWLFVLAEVTAVARTKARSVRRMASGVSLSSIAEGESLQLLSGGFRGIASE